MSDLTNYVSSTKEPQPVVLLLSEIADIVMGQSPGAETYCDLEDGIPFLQGCSEFGGFHPRPEIGCNPPLRVGRAGSVLISVRAPVGTMNFADQDYCIGRGLAAIYPKNGKSNRVFIKYAVENNLDFLYRRSQGSTFLAVSSADIKGIPLPNFTLIHQQKIATILTAIDTAIEKTEALIEKYRQIKAGLMHDLFTRGVLPNGQLRPSFEQAPELYKETKIGWIPNEWQVERIGELFDIQLGKMLSQKSKTGKYSAYYLGNKNVQWGNVDINNLESMDFLPNEREKFSLKKDDLLVCEGGDVGRTSIWKMEIDNCYYQKAVHRLRPKLEVISPKFMFYFMWYTKSSGGFSDFTSQTSIAHLTQEKLSKVPTFLPTKDEQLLLVKKLDSIESLLTAEENKLNKFRSAKLGLMQDLLTGKVPVTVDQPAEASNA